MVRGSRILAGKNRGWGVNDLVLLRGVSDIALSNEHIIKYIGSAVTLTHTGGWGVSPLFISDITLPLFILDITLPLFISDITAVRSTIALYLRYSPALLPFDICMT